MKIFHEGCHNCEIQKITGSIKKCKGCQFYNADWELPDLSLRLNDAEEYEGVVFNPVDNRVTLSEEVYIDFSLLCEVVDKIKKHKLNDLLKGQQTIWAINK